ncbi:LysR family transcriptional regulator, cys regulon transcriptional activator [Thiothrix caldifontis]|uniref:LysR family transcriptional regulator, cys regulon transcriptional activator n=1 Tax=Thiothrix caldifontis TaxID=525918 RepID=A0A1H3XJM2_9GAMM|nr:LysR substrate-binding domain-containing protein [Thiothrix caldifontis]SDZ99513.1 LysR family transcriptional regulator, cys regulon transcriptional activator [Thiothrix caldifontis]
MKLFQLRLLKTLLNNGMNVSRAADQHYIVQSAVSRQLGLLEEELGMPLFERKGKRLVEPTPVCKAIVQELDLIEQSLENIRAVADDYRLQTRGEIRIATTHTQAKYFLPEVMLEFRQRYPDVAIHFLQGTPVELVRMLHDGKADIAVCTEELDKDSALDSRKCYDWNHGLVLPDGHPLAEGKLTLQRIAAHPVLTYIFGFTGRSKIHETFRNAGLELDVTFAATDTDVIISYVRLGFGAGIIAKMAYSHIHDDDLVLRDLSQLLPVSTTRVAWLKNKYLKQYVMDMVDLLVEQGESEEWYA